MADTVSFASDDPEMRAATVEAQQRLSEFRRALEEDARRIIPAIGRALVKARFRTASDRADEHLWLEDIGFEGESIVGAVANEPADVPNLRLGSSVTVAPTDVSDWIYWVGEQMYGGFTVDIMNRREVETRE